MKQLHRAALMAAMLTVPAATAVAQDNSTAGTTTSVNATGGTATTTGNQMTTDAAMTGTTGTNAMGTTGMDNTMSDPSAMNTMETDTANMTAMDTGYETNEQYTQVQQEEDNDFPWGLLGLLGLAGLLGGRKKSASDIHVDARHNNRP